MLTAAIPTLVGLMFRHILTAVGAVLVTRGWIDPGSLDGLAGCFETSAPVNETADMILGGIMAAVGLGWSGMEKRRRE